MENRENAPNLYEEGQDLKETGIDTGEISGGEKNKLIDKINERASNASDKIRERVERFIERIRTMGESSLDDLENDFYHLAENPNHECGGGHYEGWNAGEIKELYYVLYGKEIGED